MKQGQLEAQQFLVVPAHLLDEVLVDVKTLEECALEDELAELVHVAGELDDLGGHRVQQTLTDEMVEQIISQRDPEAIEEEE